MRFKEGDRIVVIRRCNGINTVGMTGTVIVDHESCYSCEDGKIKIGFDDEWVGWYDPEDITFDTPMGKAIYGDINERQRDDSR